MTALNIIRSSTISTLATVFHQNMCHFLVRSRLAPLTFRMVNRKSTNVDVLDVFTTQILEKKNSTTAKVAKRKETTETPHSDRSNFWKEIVSKTQAMIDSTKVLIVDDWNQTDIDDYLIVSMDCGDRKTFNELIEQILISKRLPSEAVILRVLCHLCDDSDHSMSTVSRLIDVCQEMNLAFYANNMEFAPFLSQYLWKLEHFDDALNTLNSIYNTTNKVSKSLILRNYRQIIYDCVKNHDEIVRDKVIANAAQINEKHKDTTLLNYVWRDCFFSVLFRNQQKANELFAIHDEIRQAISKDIGWIALNLLQQHNVDAMHRLIEQCLAANMKREVGICLTSLFDYHCKHKINAFKTFPLLMRIIFLQIGEMIFDHAQK